MESIQQYHSSDEGSDEATTHEPPKKLRKTKSTSPGITLLTSPNDIDISNHTFKRTKPHVQGNWAGNVFISLCNNDKSDETPTSELKVLACETVRLFHENLGQQQTMQLRTESVASEDIVIVPHVDMNESSEHSECCDSDSNYDSPSDSEIDCSNDENASSESMQSGLHISLAKPFNLQKQSIESFVCELKRRMSIIHPFTMQFDMDTNKTEILVNDASTRSFLTLPISNGNEPLKNLVSSIDVVLSKYGLETYYTNPKFHCSIASWKGNQQWVNDSVSMLDKTSDATSPSNATSRKNNRDHQGRRITFFIRGIHCNFGTTEKHFIPLNSA